MSEQNRPAADLVRASEHLLYEIEMVGHTAQLLYGSPKANMQAHDPPGPSQDRNSDYWVDRTEYFAVLESLLTHARSLMNFFHPGRARQSDLLARDYIPDWRAPKKWPTFDKDRNRISTELSHLSFNRPTPSRPWDYGQLVGNLNVMLRQFIEDVPAAHVTADFKYQARAALANPFAGWTTSTSSVPTQTFASATRLVERH
jgi:hypothetical protein